MDIKNNYFSLQKKVHALNPKTKIIIVTKNQSMPSIKELLDIGHLDFGENRVQEATVKWNNISSNFIGIKLHMIGKLQSNKAKEAVKVFDFIHSLDSENLALKLFNAEFETQKKLKYFIQVNTGEETQKSGIKISECEDFIDFCLYEKKLNIIGLMCLPPKFDDCSTHFKLLREISIKKKLKELSMGMSGDFETGIKNGSTYIRIGSLIFS